MYGSSFQIECHGFDEKKDGKVQSHVADQPSSDFETQSGALNRAREAKRMFQEKGKTADFYVGVSEDTSSCKTQYATRLAG